MLCRENECDRMDLWMMSLQMMWTVFRALTIVIRELEVHLID